jgi:cytochrome oxidase Cu insertion factor (SCO1/SenC/PrrC family)
MRMKKLFRGFGGFGLALLSSALFASQLGPKDGFHLAPADLDRVRAGQKAPDFSLQSADGRTLSLSDFRGKNVVLVFYRGYW